MQYQNTFFDYTAKVIVRNSLCVLAPHPSLYRSIILAISNWLTMPSSSKLGSIDSNGLRSSRRVEWKRLWRLAQGSLRSRRLEVVGTRHERGITACLPRARPFSLSPATSKRLLRRLGAGLPCKAQRFVACNKALRGALVADREKEGARRLWFLINGDSVSSHDHGFSNSLIIQIENTKEINV